MTAHHASQVDVDEATRWGLEPVEAPAPEISRGKPPARKQNGSAGDGKPARRAAADTFGPDAPEPPADWIEARQAMVAAIEPPVLEDLERIPDVRQDPAFEPGELDPGRLAELEADAELEAAEAHRRVYGASEAGPEERPRPERVADMRPPVGLDDFVIDRFLRRNVLGMLAGPAGAGKSQARKDLEIVASTGHAAVVGHYGVPEPLTVLTLDEDNGAAEEYRRDEIYLAHHALRRDELIGCYRVSWPGLRLETDESQAWLEQLVDETYAAGARARMLLILDPVSHMYAVKELREELLPVYQFLRRLLRERPWLTILLVHHLRKLAQGSGWERTLDDVRGGPWGGWVDVVAILAPMGDRRARWSLHKRIPPSSLILEQTAAGPFVFIADAETRERKTSSEDRVLACIESGATRADEIVLATGIPKRTVFAAVGRLRKAGLLEADGPYRRTAEEDES